MTRTTRRHDAACEPFSVKSTPQGLIAPTQTTCSDVPERDGCDARPGQLHGSAAARSARASTRACSSSDSKITTTVPNQVVTVTPDEHEHEQHGAVRDPERAGVAVPGRLQLEDGRHDDRRGRLRRVVHGADARGLHHRDQVRHEDDRGHECSGAGEHHLQLRHLAGRLDRRLGDAEEAVTGVGVTTQCGVGGQKPPTPLFASWPFLGRLHSEGRLRELSSGLRGQGGPFRVAWGSQGRPWEVWGH